MLARVCARLAAILLVTLALGCGARTELRLVAGAAAGPRLDAGRADAGRTDAGSSDAPAPAPDRAEPDARVCGEPQRLTLVAASVVLVLDRSGSMMRLLGAAGVTRDAALHSALGTALPDIDATTRLGALLYPVAGATPDVGTICDLPAGGLDVPIALGAASDVVRALEAHLPAGGTPTADAIARAHAALEAPAFARGPRAILLATDGGPNCNPSGLGTDWYGVAPESCIDGGIDVATCLDTERAVEAILAARGGGIPTYVVGMDVTLPVLTASLDEMAVAGGRPRRGTPRFFAVERPVELQAALAEIAAEVPRCTFEGPVPLEPEGGTVAVDGDPVPPGERGWSMGDDGTIVLHGEACDRALEPGTEVTFEPACR